MGYIKHIIRNNTENTKVDVDEFVVLLNKGFEIIEQFYYEEGEEIYYVLGRLEDGTHIHEAN